MYIILGKLIVNKYESPTISYIFIKLYLLLFSNNNISLLNLLQIFIKFIILLFTI